jgi:hypothetical protein
MASGRLIPCNLKYSPQALQTGSPSLLRRHSVVVRVPQFVQHKPKRLVAVCLKKYDENLISLTCQDDNGQNIFESFLQDSKHFFSYKKLELTSLLLGLINGRFMPFILW